MKENSYTDHKIRSQVCGGGGGGRGGGSDPMVLGKSITKTDYFHVPWKPSDLACQSL